MQSKVVKNELVVGVFIAIGVLLAGVWATQRSRDKGLLDTHRIVFEVEHGSGQCRTRARRCSRATAVSLTGAAPPKKPDCGRGVPGAQRAFRYPAVEPRRGVLP